MLLAAAGPGLAPRQRSPGVQRRAAGAADQIVEFSADQVIYDSDADVVTATGAVRMSREGNYLAADQVVWNRKTGEVRAEGNVVVVNPQGDKLIGDNVVLTDTLRDGTIDNLLVVLESGGRIAASRGTRSGDITTLENAIYSPCPVTTDSGCPKRPSWAITAARVIDDPAHDRVRFEGGRLQLFGVTLPLLPVFSIGTRHRAARPAGWCPTSAFRRRKGFELALPYHWQLGPNRDLTLTPHVYTGVLPAIEAKYRELNSIGAFQLGGFLTYGTIDNVDPTSTVDRATGIRGYFEGNGKFQLDPCGASPARSASRPTRPSPAATTSPATTACARRQCRADQPEQLYLDRRLGVPGPARRRRAEANPDRPAGDRRALPARRRSPAASVELQANSLSILRSRARTRSAPSPARDGTCGG